MNTHDPIQRSRELQEPVVVVFHDREVRVDASEPGTQVVRIEITYKESLYGRTLSELADMLKMIEPALTAMDKAFSRKPGPWS